MVVAHNHPSGNLKPSLPDESLTKKIKESAAMMDIKLLDHIIVTKEGYYSFADEGLLGVESDYPHAAYVKKVEEELQLKRKYNKISIEKLAATFGITDKTHV